MDCPSLRLAYFSQTTPTIKWNYRRIGILAIGEKVDEVILRYNETVLLVGFGFIELLW